MNYRKRAAPKTIAELPFQVAIIIVVILIAPLLVVSLFFKFPQKFKVTHLRFNSAFSEDEEYNTYGDLLAPNGKTMVQLLVKLLNGRDLRPDLDEESWEFNVLFEQANHHCRLYQIGERSTLIVETIIDPVDRSAISKYRNIWQFNSLFSNKSKRTHKAFIEHVKSHLQTDDRFVGKQAILASD